ncbi:MAG: hypothetical protein ACI8W3_001692 [Myxococcota bacterium]|jgi:hypothetical protein
MNVTYHYAAVLLWGLVVVAAYLGFGRTVERLAKGSFAVSPSGPADWGLHSVWGMSLVLLLCGFLLSAGLFTQLALDAIVVIGLALFGYDWWRSRANGQAGVVSHFHPGELVPLALLALLYAGSVSWLGETDRNDDLVSYFAFPKLMLQTGSFDDPFAFRRMTTYGAQSALQALTTRFGNEMNYHFADCGVARLLFYGLVRGMLLPVRSRSPLLFSAMLCFALLFPIPRNNTTSELVHAVLLLATLRTLVFASNREPDTGEESPPSLRSFSLAHNALCALVIFAASAFRPHIGLTAALLYVAEIAFANGRSSRAFGIDAVNVVTTGLASAAMLAPWVTMLHRSSGTLVFPPFRGNLTQAFAGMHAHTGPFIDALSVASGFFSHPIVVAMLLPIVVLAVVGERLLRSVAAVSLALTVATAFASTALSFPYFYRYVWPIPFATMLFMVGHHLAKQDAAFFDHATVTVRAVVGASFVAAISIGIPQGVEYTSSIARDIPRQIEAAVSPLRRNQQAVYEAAQRTIPAGSNVLAMTDLPYLFDQSRNRVMTIDAPGAVSPGTQIPLGQGPPAIRDYLLDLGIEFIVFTPFDAAILQYRREYWVNNPRPERFYTDIWAPPMLSLMDAVEAYRAEGRSIYAHRKLEVLDLRTGFAPQSS